MPAANREIVLGGVAGQVPLIVAAWLVEQTRNQEVRFVQHYQNKPYLSDRATFLGVYSLDPEKREEEQSKLYLPGYALYPEQKLPYFRIDRIKVLRDSNPEQKEGERIVESFVLVRIPWTGVRSKDDLTGETSTHDRVFRLKVKVTMHLASNGNMGKQEWEVEMTE